MTSSNSSDIAHRDQLTSSSSSAYVRPIKPSEIPVLAAIYQRAFARDPMMNWFGGVRTLVPHYTAQDPHTRRTLTALGHFQLVLVKMAQISGLGTVIVERSGEGKEGPGREAEEAEERIVGGALWLSPGMSMDPSPLTFVRISPWKAVWNWGLGALKRMFFEYTPTAEKIVDEVFALRGLKRLDSWHLLMIAIDPEYEGKGYSTLLMRDGFNRAGGGPVYLEATTPRSRDIYAHLGFELNKVHRFGVESVDEMGIVTKGEAAVGVPIFVMTKWETP